MSSAAASVPTPDLLVKLSDACTKHQLQHAGHDEETFLDEEQVPTACRAMIKSLRKILPKLEKGCQTEWPHLCDYYSQVLAGGFCPHAPHLFLLGRQGGKEVFPRVHLLFEASLEQDHPSICQTIANLLQFLPRSFALRHEWMECTIDIGWVLQVDTYPVEFTLVGNHTHTIHDRSAARKIQTTFWSVLLHWYALVEEEDNVSSLSSSGVNLDQHTVALERELGSAARFVLFSSPRATSKATKWAALQWMQQYQRDERVLAQVAVYHGAGFGSAPSNTLLSPKKLAAVVGSLKHSATTVLPLLLDGLPQLKKSGSSNVVLQQAFLRTIHRLLIVQQRSQQTAISTVLNIEQNTVWTLWQCLREPVLHDLALFVLSQIWTAPEEWKSGKQQQRNTLSTRDDAKRPHNQTARPSPRKRPRTSMSSNDNKMMTSTEWSPSSSAGYATPGFLRELLEWLLARVESLQSISTADHMADVVSVVRLLVYWEKSGNAQQESLLDHLVNLLLKHPPDDEIGLQLLLTCAVHLPPRYEKLRSTAQKLFCQSQRKQQQQPHTFPMPLLESLYHGGLQQSLKGLSFSQLSDQYPVVRAEVLNLGAFLISHDGVAYAAEWEGPFVSLTNSEESQMKRLVHLQPKGDSTLCLRERTRDVLVKPAAGSDETPEMRLRRWQSLAWLMRVSSSAELRQLLASENNWVHSLLDVAFADPDGRVREYAARELGAAFGSWENVKALLSKRDEWPCTDLSCEQELVDRFFRHVDHLLHTHCCIPQSQLSFTVGSNTYQEEKHSDQMREHDRVTVFQRAAVRSLLSLCRQDSKSYFGQRIFVGALTRVVRLWSASEGTRGVRQWICFAELSRLCQSVNVARIAQEECMDSIMPSLFSEVLVPSPGVLVGDRSVGIENIRPGIRETQCTLLSSFIQTFLLKNDGEWLVAVLGRTDVTDLERCLERAIPYVFAQLIVEKDYDSLRLTTLYKLFLLGRKKFEAKQGVRIDDNGVRVDQAMDIILGGSRSTFSESTIISRVWTYDLDEQAAYLCMAEYVRILPLVLTTAGRSELYFMSKVVLRGRNPLKPTVCSKERQLLKNLVWQLGASKVPQEASARAIKVAALARVEELDSGRALSDVSLSLDSNIDGSDRIILSEWVTSNFMFVLVNVVQTKWTSRSDAERIQAMRSLNFLMDLLNPDDSVKYFPQVLATFNAVISLPESSDSSHSETLQFLAVQILFKFVRLVSISHWDILGHNLNVVVVSLIPIVVDGDMSTSNDGTSAKMEAISLLEWLVAGELGEKLTGFFSAIPFLPASPELENMRISLRELGVDFDQVITTQGTQEAISNHSHASVDDSASLDNGSSASSNAVRQETLRRRLGMVCTLLSNENTGIRKVVLKHATDLIKANRDLFHALVQNEGDTSMKHYITVALPGTAGASRGAMTEFVEGLLSRCVNETDPEARDLLASCIGEVGAISIHYLEECDASSQKCDTRKRAPWHSRADRYGLQLVTNELVAALKAAPSANDQHKIAFSIQQILVLLDRAATEGEATSTNRSISKSEEKHDMSEWLHSNLSDAGVLEVVEPFWTTEFCETETSVTKRPPFFRHATTYFGWMSNWCRYMVLQSKEKKNKWSDLFYSCRTSLRTHVGLDVAEFLLPALVLDRICDGVPIEDEIVEALTFDSSCRTTMGDSERQKVVATLLDLVDTLQLWFETESVAKKSRASTRGTGTARKTSPSVNGHWNIDICKDSINTFVENIPLSTRAKAAAAVGMHARALRLFEMLARSKVAKIVFDAAPGEHPKRPRPRAAGRNEDADMHYMKETLGALNDYDTMSCLMEDGNKTNPTARIRGGIKLKEVSSNWEGALQDYERALQLQDTNNTDPELQKGALRCLLELGQFKSVLNQVTGLLHTGTTNVTESATAEGSIPYAIEASWRLGNWDALSDFVSRYDKSPSATTDTPYEICQGNIMLNLKRKDLDGALQEICRARKAVMEKLSISASEGYSRAYCHLVELHGLREFEDVAELLCSEGASSLGDLANDVGFSWDRRLGIVNSSGITSLMNGRLALARLAEDSFFEGSLFLDTGRRARKHGLQGMAANALAQAEAVFHKVGAVRGGGMTRSVLLIQFAKLKHECGESSTALQMLHNEDMESMVDLQEGDLHDEVMKRVTEFFGTSEHGMTDEQAIDVFARIALQSTQWMVEGGLKGSAEIMSRFKVLHRVAPKWEKGHFYFAKYVDSILRSRIAVLHQRSPEIAGGNDEHIQSAAISRDKTCQRYVLLAIKHYVETLTVDTKHIYQALPRLLSLWFEFTSMGKTETLEGRHESIKMLLDSQEEANAVMANKFKHITASAFYTALPQLISRIKHPDKNSVLVVRGILRRVLTKYPAQAMWHLAWLRNSHQKDRRKAGDEIFREAERTLLTKAPNKSLHSLLVASKSLFTYLQKLAEFEPKGSRIGDLQVKSWKGEVDLVEFVPPVQAALSASLSCGDSSRTRDLFPRHVPRMRAFANRVRVMNSKARPKILKAFVVASESSHKCRASQKLGKKDTELDIGEISFLVKQEAKGDLRKDARVQDLNAVINRLLASFSGGSVSDHQQRRLRLRTFAVTCLSEDTGILEWIPDTASFRSLVGKTYNPQASELSSRRDGEKLANLSDPSLKSNYDECQAMFFKSKDIKNAAKLFDNLCLREHPPLFYWWFIQNFQDSHAWYEARTRFTLSCAAWSAVGHVIGIGDRHSENILLDTKSGECVHVDFDCIFDKGLHLPKPEVVPFRLTQNMIDAFGPTGSDGVFSGSLKTAMLTLRNNRDTLLSVLEPFLKDPVIDWKRYRSQQQSQSKAANEEKQTREAKRSINVIDERLQGIYNLRNPNYKRIRSIQAQQGEDGHMLPLSVEGQVHKMIAEATSSENLVQMYIGWMPWI